MIFRDVTNKNYLISFFVFGWIEVLLCSGITYGWASIVYIFKVEHFYMTLCDEEKSFSLNQTVTNSSSISLLVGEDGLPGCLKQDKIFNLIFTVAVVFFTSVQFPTGLFIDKFGPRIARIVGGLMYVLSCFGLGFIGIGYEDFLFPVFTMICVGGGMLAMSIYQVGNIIYREHRSKVICFFHGAFDSSAVMLLTFKLIYDREVKYRDIMIFYSAFCLILIGFGTIVMIPTYKTLLRWSEEEKKMYRQVNDADKDADFMHKSLDASYNSSNKKTIKVYKPKVQQINNSAEFEMNKKTESQFVKENHNGNSINEAEEEGLDSNDKSQLVESGSIENLEEVSVWRSITSPLYLFELLYLTTFQLKLWYFVGALAEDLIYMTHNNKALVSKYINIFGYIQFGGFIFTPIIGFIFDKDKGKENQALLTTPRKAHLKRVKDCIFPFALTGILCIVLCVVSTIKSLELQILSFFLYMITRGFLYSNHGAYIGAVFPASQFGTLYGFGIFIAGVIGSLQYAFFELKSNLLGGDPLWVNVILLVLCTIANTHPFYLWWYHRRESKKLL